MPDKQDFSFQGVAVDDLSEARPAPEVYSDPEVLRYTPPKRLKLVGVVVAGAALCVVGVGLLSRMFAANEVNSWTHDQAVPIVNTIAPVGANGARSLVLPGSVQAYNNAPIFAQISGYVQKWFVDIGTPVKAGDLLAQVDPRTYKAALDQARGQLARDMANLTNAKLDLGRYQSLAAQNAISSQQLATQQATVNADAGLVESDKAAVETAQINLGYTRIVAPFDGIVTSRSVDIGNFVAAGSASATPLFTVSDQSKVRIYVRVPQSNSADIAPGTSATFTVPEYPNRKFTATVQANSGAVDPASGSVLVQLQADNKDHMLKPGAYAEVQFALHSNAVAIQVPSSAVIFRDGGMAVATVSADNKVAIRRVEIAHDYGTSVELASGVRSGDRIIDNPPDSLDYGDTVRVASAARPRRRTAEQ